MNTPKAVYELALRYQDRAFRATGGARRVYQELAAEKFEEARRLQRLFRKTAV